MLILLLLLRRRWWWWWLMRERNRVVLEGISRPEEMLFVEKYVEVNNETVEQGRRRRRIRRKG